MQKSSPTNALDRVIAGAILAGRIAAGARLGEQGPPDLFSVSRTVARKALFHLEARDIVQISARRGCLVIKPPCEEAQEAFEACQAIETGILMAVYRFGPEVVENLRTHIVQEREAIASRDLETRSFLLGDFPVWLFEAYGYRVLADILRNLTARTVMISALYQFSHDATVPCDEHVAITDALAAGDLRRDADLLVALIGYVEAGLARAKDYDSLASFRQVPKLPKLPKLSKTRE